MRVLVIAGEPSGDRTIASVLAALSVEGAIAASGLGGDAIAAAGAELVAHVRDVAAMGVAEVVARAPTIARALGRLVAHARRARPDVAILASWSSANARVGRALRAMGVPVVWIAPPEVWAWGSRRVHALARAADRFVVTLPFEVALWRAAGADAHWFGHPAAFVPRRSRDEARVALGLAGDATAIAVLPGSRRAEVSRLAAPMIHAVERLGRARSIEARVLRAPSLPDETAGALARMAGHASIAIEDVSPERGAIEHLAAFDAALVASGTASLECAIAGVPPVVAYGMHPLTLAVARAVVRTDVIALPNVLLARTGEAPAFEEIVAARPDAAALEAALSRTLARADRARAACDRVVGRLRANEPGALPFDASVARLVRAIARGV